MKLFVPILTAFLALSGVAQSATLTFDEADEGDAPNSFRNAADIGDLSGIVDTINVFGGTDFDFGDIRDYFAFSSDRDFEFVLNSISITNQGSASFWIYEDAGPGSPLATDPVRKAVRNGTSGLIFDTFAACTYLVRLNANKPNEGIITDYSFSLNAPTSINTQAAIAPVPLPAGLPLFASAFVLFAWMRRRIAA